MKVRLQSGCVPYRVVNGSLQVLLVKKKTKKAWWGFTKGGLEPHLTPRDNAAKECFEEAGVTGNVTSLIGDFSYQKDGKHQSVSMYAMETFTELHTWPEHKWRVRKWVSLQEAKEKLSSELHHLIDRLEEVVR